MLLCRTKRSVLVNAGVGPAGIGLFSQFSTNPLSLLKSSILMLRVALAFFAVLYFITQRKQTHSDDMKKYKQAVKQSKSKYNRGTPGPERKVIRSSQQQVNSKHSKRATHLRVIDGNKPKRKNRANL